MLIVGHWLSMECEGFRKQELMIMPRQQNNGELKMQVVIQALRGDRTINEMAADFGVYSLQMMQ
jgi:hypothetical protein